MSGEEMFQGMRYVYEVYREMSFSRAAKKLFISQPSLSNAVRKTEQKLGAPLFDRSTNPIGLTDLGKEYIRAVELILDVENGFVNYLHDRNALQNGSVSIGGTNVFTSYALPPLVSQFTEQFPQIHIELVEAVTSELKDRLSMRPPMRKSSSGKSISYSPCRGRSRSTSASGTMRSRRRKSSRTRI